LRGHAALYLLSRGKDKETSGLPTETIRTSYFLWCCRQKWCAYFQKTYVYHLAVTKCS